METAGQCPPAPKRSQIMYISQVSLFLFKPLIEYSFVAECLRITGHVLLPNGIAGNFRSKKIKVIILFVCLLYGVYFAIWCLLCYMVFILQENLEDSVLSRLILPSVQRFAAAYMQALDRKLTREIIQIKSNFFWHSVTCLRLPLPHVPLPHVPPLTSGHRIMCATLIAGLYHLSVIDLGGSIGWNSFHKPGNLHANMTSDLHCS